MKKLLFVFSVVLFSVQPIFAVEKITVTENIPFLMLFDSKVSKVEITDSANVKYELVNTILNDKQELILKPLKPTMTKMVVWNESNKTVFDLEVIKSDEISKVLGELELDSPDGKSKGFSDLFLNIDKPPYMKGNS